MQLAPAPLPALVDEADMAVHGLVLTATTTPVPDRPHQLRTHHLIMVWEHLKPTLAAPVHHRSTPVFIEVVQPGGVLDGLATVVPGVAALRPGDEVVLLLGTTPWGLQPIGYRMGTFFVAPDGRVRPAWSGHMPLSPASSFSMDVLRGVLP